MFFHWRLSDSKSPQVSRTLLSILANLNNAVVLMISTHSLISKSSSALTNPLVTVPRAPITTGINVTLMFHSFFQFPSKFQVLIYLFFSFSFNFTLWSAGTVFSAIWQILFFFVNNYKVLSSG